MKALGNLPYHIVSLLAHCLVVIPLIIFTQSSFNDKNDLNQISKKMRIVGKAIRVELISMPKFTLLELKTMTESRGDGAKAVIKKVTPSGGDENTIFKKEIKKLSFAERMKELSSRNVKKTKFKQPRRKSKKSGRKVDVEDYSDGRFDKVLAMGNRLSKGSSIYGAAGSNAGDLFDKYAISIMEEVKKQWRLPGYLSGKTYQCKIQLFIGQSGKVLKHIIIESSGNSDYDNWALQAVLNVKKFKAPKSEIASRVASGEIALAFPL